MIYSVTFTKRFTGGLLDGIAFTDRVTYSTWQGAQRYATFLESHRVEPVAPCAGSSPYVVTGDVLIERSPSAFLCPSVSAFA